MNDMMNLPSVGEIKLPEGPKLESFFRSDDAVEQMICQIEQTVRAHVPDLTTKKGREAVASLAYNVSKSKTFLDGEGKKLVDGIKKQAEGIDKSRKVIRDRLDALRDEARAPLTKWEAEDAERKARDEEIVRQISDHGLTGFEPSADIIAKGHQIKSIGLPDDFGGDREAVEAKRTATMQALRNMYDTSKKREDDAVELDRLRAEQEEREREKQADKFADDLATAISDLRRGIIGGQAYPYIILLRDLEEKLPAEIEATGRHRERLDRLRVDAIDHIKQAQAARDERERAEAARKEADERAAAEIEHAKREAAEAVERAHREAQEQIEKERKEAAERERLRLEAEDQARIKAAEIAAQQEAEAQRRAASEARRDEVREDIEAALAKMAGRATPAAIANAIINGEIPHVQVVL